MRKYLRVLWVTGLLAGMVLVGACGGGGGDAAAPAPPHERTIVAVNEANAVPGYDASTEDVTFNLSPNPNPALDYTYIVDQFDTGDKLVFVAGTVQDVRNLSVADGEIDVIGSWGGQVATVHLTGIDAAVDATIVSKDTFNAAFGAGSLLP